MVYYRKYRPQTISELDNKHVRETLFSILKDSPPHAFLFTGPKGLGKTSAARIVAKAVNCLHGENIVSSKSLVQSLRSIEPDNTCSQCISITSGSNLDVLEIDGASNRGIDEIRSLREKVHLAPSQAKVKVYIIDEVHMLTTEAFNALLKTVEEPPAHVMFIFCTTEPSKVPSTIISRCFHVAFQMATEEEIVHSLKRIVEGEHIKIQDAELYEIAKLAEGGFRDAAKILEELVALHGKKISPEHFQSSFHTAHILLTVNNLLSFIAEKKTKESLQIVAEITNQGIDSSFFIKQILSRLHEILLAKMEIKGNMANFPENLRFDLKEFSMLNKFLSEAYEQTKFSPIQQLPLELAIISYCSLQFVIPSDPERKSNGESRDDKSKIKHTIDSLVKKQQILKVQNALSGDNSKSKAHGSHSTISSFDKASAGEQKDIHSAGTTDELSALMENLIYKVKGYNHSVAGILRGCKIQSFSETSIVFATSYKFHKERLEEKKAREILEKGLKELTGKQLKIMIELKGK